LGSAALVFLLAGCGLVQAPTIIGRVTQEIDSRFVASISGTVNPHAIAQCEIGRVDAGTMIEGVTMYFKPTAERKSELDALVKAQQTPCSSNYHKWHGCFKHHSRGPSTVAGAVYFHRTGKSAAKLSLQIASDFHCSGSRLGKFLILDV